MTLEKKTENVVEVQENTQVDDERKWCVYCHTNKTNGKKYFGITCLRLNDRWRNGKGYVDQPVFWNAIKKYTWDGFLHEVIADGLTENEAKKKEIELIALYKTNCCKYDNPELGYNMTDGGDGISGWHHSEESKRKMRESRKVLSGENHPMYGRKHTQETKNKIRISRQRISLSEECKIKMSKSKIGIKNNQAVCVYCIETNTIFGTIIDGANYAGVSRISLENNLNNKWKHAGRHPVTGEQLSWKYVFDKTRKNGVVIPGAITLEYITEEEVNEYLNNLKQKGNGT